MAHFAKIDENNIVLEVIVISNMDCGNLEFPESEPVGQDFIKSLGIEGHWKQTSYNGNFRKRYAGIDYIYDEINDVFLYPNPGDQYVLDEEFEWVLEN
jgi:hypothetical protein